MFYSFIFLTFERNVSKCVFFCEKGESLSQAKCFILSTTLTPCSYQNTTLNKEIFLKIIFAVLPLSDLLSMVLKLKINF